MYSFTFSMQEQINLIGKDILQLKSNCTPFFIVNPYYLFTST
jgi:hypothetical protein